MRLGLAGLPVDDLEFVVEAVQHHAPHFQDARILITGASGFVGMWITASLVELRRQLSITNMNIDIVVRNADSARSRLGDDVWNQVGITESDLGVGLALDTPVTHVIHGATPSSIRSGSADARGVLLTAVNGTQHLINALQNSERPRVLHLSSGAVYGAQPPEVERIPETWLGGPAPFLSSAPYAEGKRAAEALLESAGRDGLLEPIQARLFAFLGPELPINEGFAIGNFVSRASQGSSVDVTGDGSPIRSYLDARDLTAWIIKLLNAGEPGTPYNVGSPSGHSLRYWAELCSELFGVDTRYGDSQIGDRTLYVPDISNSIAIAVEQETEDLATRILSWGQWLKLRR